MFQEATGNWVTGRAARLKSDSLKDAQATTTLTCFQEHILVKESYTFEGAVLKLTLDYTVVLRVIFQKRLLQLFVTVYLQYYFFSFLTYCLCN